MPVEQIWVICAGAAAARLADVTASWRTPAGTFAGLASDKQVANAAAALERSGQHGGAGVPVDPDQVAGRCRVRAAMVGGGQVSRITGIGLPPG